MDVSKSSILPILSIDVNLLFQRTLRPASIFNKTICGGAQALGPQLYHKKSAALSAALFAFYILHLTFYKP
jgi:hypothetical protein